MSGFAISIPTAHTQKNKWTGIITACVNGNQKSKYMMKWYAELYDGGYRGHELRPTQNRSQSKSGEWLCDNTDMKKIDVFAPDDEHIFHKLFPTDS